MKPNWSRKSVVNTLSREGLHFDLYMWVPALDCSSRAKAKEHLIYILDVYMYVDGAACWTVLRLPVYHRALKQSRVNAICLTCSHSFLSCSQKTFKYRATSSSPYQILLKEYNPHQHSLTSSGCAVCSAWEAGLSHSLAWLFHLPWLALLCCESERGCSQT